MKRKPELYTRSWTWLLLGMVLGAAEMIGGTVPGSFTSILLCFGIAAVLEKMEQKP